MEATLTLRHLCFEGPKKSPASIEFGPGLNVIHGASDTGKSFILESVDFMLGASSSLRDIPERVGYDRVFLGVEDSFGETFTLERSASGGSYRRYDGLHFEVPREQEATILRAQHNPTRDDSLSMYLLAKVGLAGKKIRRNAGGDTNSLSIRNLARLCLVPEQEIQKQGSPILTGQWPSATAEYSVFKLLLTGVDDSAVQPTEPDRTRRLSRAAKIEVLDELILSYRERLTGIVGEDDNDAELRAQLTRLDESIEREQDVLSQSEKEYRDAVATRSRLRNELATARERRAEISELLARFALLDEHYSSDLERLDGIREAGVLVSALDSHPCPLCGATADAQHLDGECDGNVDAVVAAVDVEHEKIVRLQTELRETVRQLYREAGEVDELWPRIEGQLELALGFIAEINPSLSAQRAAYSELMQKRSAVQNAINLLQSIEELESRRADLDASPEVPEAPQPAERPSADLSFSTLDAFCKQYERVLKSWNFPDSDRVFFDKDSRDFVIAGKPRGARGKGMRAITYAAFTVALLEYTRDQDLPHLGFVVLDTPLLAYREPEGEDDDLLAGTDVHQHFYQNLAKLADRQVIVLENVDPPSALVETERTTFFTKNPSLGRYGFF